MKIIVFLMGPSKNYYISYLTLQEYTTKIICILKNLFSTYFYDAKFEN
jgi:hypothetical protein